MAHQVTAPRARWWAALALGFTFLIAPGPQRSFFSGAPLSSRATVVFLGLAILAVFSALFPPERVARFRWLLILGVAVIAKLVTAPLLVDTGWRAEYLTPVDWTRATPEMRRAEFITSHGIQPSRVDATPEVPRAVGNLTFLNDLPRAIEWIGQRDLVLPLIVRWRGWPQSPVGDVSVTASGRVRCFASGRMIFDAVNPRNVHFRIGGAGGSDGIAFEYSKPSGAEAAMTVAGLPMRVVPEPTSPDALVRSDRVAGLIAFLGVITLIAIAFALFDAYPRMSELLLEHVWDSPMKVAAIAFFAAFIATGVRESIPIRHLTQVQTLGDDALIYESQARTIARYGLMMVDPHVPATPYYFYPFYSYVLAAVHRLFGDDTANIVLLNYICMASIGLLVFALLRRHVSTGAGIATLMAVAFFEWSLMRNYAASAFTDNLYIPLTLLLVLSCARALEVRSSFLLFATGALTAIASATRPSALLFAPCFGVWLLLEPGGRPFLRRIREATAFSAGFVAGIFPFTLRNWIVSHKFVLLISSFIMISFFLYPPEVPVPPLGGAHGGAPNFVESLHQFADCWRQFPGRTLWTEARKVLFTLGLTKFGPPGATFMPVFVVLPILFALSLWSGRIPRHLRNAILVFGASHVIALTIAAPWTYGYKTIMPLHLLFIITAAFLLPNWGEQREIEAAPPTPLRKSNRRRQVSVVLPTYNEKDSIRAVIDGFFATGLVDEVLVINNNAAEGTSEMVAGSGAVEIFERRQGYGAAIRRGLAEAQHELIVVCEPDGTFLPADVEKLLAYSDDFDVVYGSRTSQQLVWRGANMGMFLRWGNWVVAKYLEFLYNATSLTDVGCTMRLVRRDCARALAGRFRIAGSQFGPEMMIETLRAGYRVIQIPVNYMPRVGVSAVTGDPAKAFKLGLEMILLITWRRFEDLSAKPSRLPFNATEERRS